MKDEGIFPVYRLNNLNYFIGMCLRSFENNKSRSGLEDGKFVTHRRTKVNESYLKKFLRIPAQKWKKSLKYGLILVFNFNKKRIFFLLLLHKKHTFVIFSSKAIDWYHYWSEMFNFKFWSYSGQRGDPYSFSKNKKIIFYSILNTKDIN